MIDPILIYLAGPIDDVEVEEAQGWREQIAVDLPEGVVLFSPAHAFLNVNASNIKRADWANRHVINCADAVIANLDGDGRGFGTIREIEFAVRIGRPVVVVGQLESLMQYDLEVVGRLDEALMTALELVAEKRDDRAFSLPSFLGIKLDEDDD